MAERLSPAFQKLTEMCATCGGPMPCALHDAALREAMLRPREHAGLPWDKIERREIGRYSESVSALVPLADGTFIVGGFGGEIEHLDPRKPVGEQEALLDYYVGSDYHTARAVYAAHLLPDQTVLLCGRDGGLVQYDPAKPEGQRTEVVARFGVDLNAIAPRADGMLLIASAGNGIYVFDPVRKQSVDRIECRSSVYAVHELPDGALLVGRSNGYIVKLDWKRPPGEQEEVVGRYGDIITAFAPLPDGTLIVGGQCGRIVRLDPAAPEGARMEDLGNYGFHIYAIRVTSDHSFIVAGDSGVIAEYAIPEHIMVERRNRALNAPEIPPMPEA